MLRACCVLALRLPCACSACARAAARAALRFVSCAALQWPVHSQLGDIDLRIGKLFCACLVRVIMFLAFPFLVFVLALRLHGCSIGACYVLALYTRCSACCACLPACLTSPCLALPCLALPCLALPCLQTRKSLWWLARLTSSHQPSSLRFLVRGGG